jgi:hypothetical protein
MKANTNSSPTINKSSLEDTIASGRNLIIQPKVKVYDIGALLWHIKRSSLEQTLDINHDVKAKNGGVTTYVGKPVGTAA